MRTSHPIGWRDDSGLVPLASMLYTQLTKYANGPLLQSLLILKGAVRAADGQSFA